MFDDYGTGDILVVSNGIVEANQISYYITEKGLVHSTEIFRMF